MRYLKLVQASIIWILVAGFIAINQQDPEEFSEDPAVFIKQLNTYFESQNNRKVQLILKEFITDWDEGKFTLQVQKEVIRNSNLMRKQNIRPHMGYSDYLEALSSFTETTGNQSILEWHKALQPFIDSKGLKQLKTYLNNTTQFNRDHVLFKQNTNVWKFEGSGFTYRYDSTLSIELKDINLICFSGRDSISILGTSGTFFPLADRFQGRDGKVNWSKYGYDPRNVYVVVDTYKVNLKETYWKADTVNFYHKVYFDKALVGSLEDRVLAGVPLERSSFPKFVSFDKDISIKNLYKNIDYFGGFTIEGSRIVGSGDTYTDANIFVKKGTELIMRLDSKSFVIRPDRLISPRTAATIYYENDSIYHPGLNLRYVNENRELALLRNGEGVSGSPFFSSFHKIDMYFQGMYYSIDADSINFEMLRGLSNKGTATFESTNFYSEERFDKLQGIDAINPINVIYNYSEKNKVKVFFLPELAKFVQKPIEQVKAMAINLSNGGFITYNIDNDRIEVKQRLYDYLNARSKKMDYDVIQIRSNVDRGANGVLNLKTFNITVRGVDSVALSDVKAVNIIPRTKEIIIGRNRDFVFTGMVKAGYFTFYANKSSFEYDKFKLSMPTIDSLSFMVDTINISTGKLQRIEVKNVLADLNGELLIDDPTNKSGIRNLPVYPLFNSHEDAFVFYDYSTIRGGAYKRENFFYTVYPFVIDSLNSFTTEGLKFDGSLNSGDIMPVIEEPLRVMEDYSLGFNRSLPPKGIPVYKDRATYYSNITLDNNGLQGDGRLEYLTSTSESKNFIFYPDSLVADLKNFDIKEKYGAPTFPMVVGEGVHQYWVPALDSMSLQTLPGKEFEMFGAKSYHSGNLTLTSRGLFGSGKSRLDNADLISNNFSFRNQSFHTDTTDFLLYYPERPSLSLSTRMNSGSVDFLNQEGVFGVLGESQRIELPHSKYVCYMDQIEWSMEKSELLLTNSLVHRSELTDAIDLKKLVDYDFSGSEFISTDPQRDSLQFFAMEASYKMKENIINARDVKIIQVADIAVFPGDGKVTILSDGDMQALEGANIIADRKHKHHRIYDASIKVNSRKHYMASGNIDYVDDAGNVRQLHLDPITVDSAQHTYGLTNIPANNFMPLNDHFNFIGNIKMKADSRNHYFDGVFQMQNACLAENRPWVRFASELDQNDIRIPITLNERDSINDPVLLGVVYSDFFSSIYPSLLERPKAFGDTLLATATGYIRYDKPSQSYITGSNERLDKKTLAGNLLIFSTEQCVLKAQGDLNIGTALGSVKMNTYGDVSQYTLVDSTRINLSVALDFFFSTQAFDRLLEDLKVTELGRLDVNTESFKLFLTSLIGETESKAFLDELNLTGQVKKVPDQLNKSMILSNLNMVWDRKLRSFVSEGKIGIAGIQRNLVNRTVDGYIEIGKRRTGDIINVYLEFSPQIWYFFSYSNGIMQAISSNNEFNSILVSLKENKRTLNTKSDETAYQFIISTPEARMAFMRKIQQRQFSE